MATSQFDQLAAQVEQLSVQDRLRLIERLTSTLQRDLGAVPAPAAPDDWHAALHATYGILADDPIRRWPQGEYEDREPLA